MNKEKIRNLKNEKNENEGVLIKHKDAWGKLLTHKEE
jgi:hypothetical protein